MTESQSSLNFQVENYAQRKKKEETQNGYAQA
jgi:hypothetical protein